MDYRKAQEQLNSGKNPIFIDNDALKYAQEPIGKAILIQSQSEVIPPKKVVRKDKQVKCGICGKEFWSKDSGKHKRTKFHKTYELLGEKLRNFILSP